MMVRDTNTDDAIIVRSCDFEQKYNSMSRRTVVTKLGQLEF